MNGNRRWAYRRSPAASPPRAAGIGLGSRRRGATIYEAILSLLIVASVLAAVAQLLHMVHRQQRAAREQTLAVREVGNAMESWMLQPWSDWKPGEATDVEPSAECRTLLPGGRLSIAVDAEGEGGPARRITVQFHWPDRGPAAVAPVRLVAWRYPGKGNRP